jgi:hypothetical protein
MPNALHAGVLLEGLPWQVLSSLLLDLHVDQVVLHSVLLHRFTLKICLDVMWV